jgi:polar amino acid transport system substrate-binding protein
MSDVPAAVIAQLAPTGVLRAGINMSNFLLVVGKTPSGDPIGPSPSMAAAIAEALGVPLQLLPYASPSAIAADAGTGTWDIGNIGAEPQRAAVMDFTAAYAEIEATYLVPPGSTIQSIDDVDRPGNRIAVSKGSAYGLWLENHITQAELRSIEGGDAAFAQFVQDKMDALASLRPRLVTDAAKLPGSRILAGQFASVQQAIGINKGHEAAYHWLKAFVEAAKANGLVARLIAEFGVQGQLSVAPLA